MGLQVNGAEVFNAAAPGTVIDIDPSGPVQPGYHHHRELLQGPGNGLGARDPVAAASEAEVQQAIEGAGLRWVKGADVEPSNKNEDAGTFVSSEPAQGRTVAAGSVVTYHLAQGGRNSDATPRPTGP